MNTLLAILIGTCIGVVLAFTTIAVDMGFVICFIQNYIKKRKNNYIRGLTKAPIYDIIRL